jgi:hypothetical protein
LRYTAIIKALFKIRSDTFSLRKVVECETFNFRKFIFYFFFFFSKVSPYFTNKVVTFSVADLVVAVVVKYCGIKNKSENFFLRIFVVVVVVLLLLLLLSRSIVLQIWRLNRTFSISAAIFYPNLNLGFFVVLTFFSFHYKVNVITYYDPK